jgi:hypothetical protein
MVEAGRVMARDLRINVDGDSGGGQRALEELAAASAAAAREADRMAAQFREAKRDASQLDKQLAETAVATRALAKEFAKTNDTGIKKQLDQQRKAAAELKRLRSEVIGDSEHAAQAAARLADSAARDFDKFAAAAARDFAKAKAHSDALAAKAAKNFAKMREEAEKTSLSFSDFTGGFGSAFSGGLTSPVGLTLGATAVVPALAGVGGALTAGAGIGAVGAGIGGAVLGDPDRFGAAWKTQTDRIKKEFIDASQPFVGPTLSAISSVGPLVASWGIDKTLGKAASYVQPLVAGLEGFASELEGGFAALVDNAGPAIQAIAANLPEAGAMISQGLKDVAANAEGGAQALGDIIQAAGALTQAVLEAVAASEEMYAGFKKADAEAANFVRSHQTSLAILTGGLSQLFLAESDAFNADEVQTYGHALSGVALTGTIAADQAAASAAAYAKLGEQLGVTAVKADNLAEGAQQIFSALLAADHATLSWDESLTNLQEALKENGKTVDEHTKKGQANREAVLSSIASNEQLYVSNIQQGKGVDFATAAYDKNEKAIEATLRQAGLSQDAIDGLVGKYRSVPDKIKTDLQMNGIANAINDLDDVLRRINHLPPRKTVDVNVVVTGQIGLAEQLLGAGIIGSLAPKRRAKGGIRHAATGLIVGPSDPGTLIGEPQTGGEALIPLRGISGARAASLAQTAVGGYGYDVVPRARIPDGLFGGRGAGGGGALTLTVEFGGAVDTAMGSAFMKLLRTGDVKIRASQLV